MNRLPIRLRLTAVFVAVMSGVLLVVGLAVYYHTEHSLDGEIARELDSRLLTLVASASNADPDDTGLPPGERQAQLFSPAGELLASQPAGAAPLLSPAEVARAARGRVTIERHEKTRMRAEPASLRGRRVVAVVASSLAQREKAIEELGAALLVGGPLALLFAAAIGYATAAAALAPVESIRRRAQGISRADPHAKVPVSEADDEIRRLGLTLNEMLARMAAGAQHERAFIANASHELRTPLAALTGELELALLHGTTEAELRAAIAAAKSDGDRLADLASHLLELAQVDEAPPVADDPVDVDELLAAVAEDLHRAASDQGREIVAAPSGFTVRGEQVALARAVRNLAENAIVHGTGTVRLAAEPSDDGRAVVIRVRSGGALHASVREGEAFERFTRGADAHARPGSGLGLALVRAIAEAHGGSASLDETPDGVEARLLLPLRG